MNGERREGGNERRSLHAAADDRLNVNGRWPMREPTVSQIYTVLDVEV